MDPVQRHQQLLIDRARQIYRKTPLSEATCGACLAVPRHSFVPRYRQWASDQWCDVTETNLVEHLGTLYADHPLILCGDDDNHVVSTISQPSFVLRMLDLLHCEPGHTVFELGTGSGWNAALLGHLVGPTGHVCSMEIIPELAQTAAETISTLGISNVHVIAGDAGEGCLARAPYDRVAFTAGTYDLPACFYEQVKEEGLLLGVIKNVGGGDNLFLLRKVQDRFESVYSVQCGFVQITGKHNLELLDPVTIEELPAWSTLRDREIERRPFWWSGKGPDVFGWQTMGIRSFLGITEPLFRSFKLRNSDHKQPEEYYFGLWDPEQHSLVLAIADELIAYGSSAAMNRLLQLLHRWVDLGMPTAASFALQVHRADVALRAAANQWIVRRRDSQFLWSL